MVQADAVVILDKATAADGEAVRRGRPMTWPLLTAMREPRSHAPDLTETRMGRG